MPSTAQLEHDVESKSGRLAKVSFSADFLFIHMTRVLQKMKFGEKRKYFLREGFGKNWALEKGHLSLQWETENIFCTH